MKYLKTEFKWALIFSAVYLLWMLVERLSGLHDEHIDRHAMYTNLFAIPAIAVYVLALIDKRQRYYRGSMTYKQGLSSGMVLTVIITVLRPLTQYITSYYIAPDYFDNAIEYAVANGEMSRDTAISAFNFRSYVLLGLIGTFVMGMLTTAVVALIVKKDRAKTKNSPT